MSVDDTPAESATRQDGGNGGRRRPSRRRVVLGVLVAIVAVIGLGGLAGVFGAPSVEQAENRFGGVNASTTTIETNVTVSNPNPVGARLGGVSVNYTVAMNELAMARGTKSGVGLETGNSTLSFTTLLRNERIPDWWVSHIRNGERTTLRVQADLRSTLLGQSVSVTPVTREIDTDLLASFATDEPQPVTTDAPVGNPVVVIEETDAAWGAVSEAETPVELMLTVHNPNQYPVVISRIGYDAAMNDIAVGEGATESGVTIPPGATKPVEARAAIDNQHLDEWWVSHIERNQVSTLRIQFFVTLDLSAVGGGEVRVPLRPMTTTIETDFFGNKPAGATSGTDTGGDATETATTSDGTTTEPSKADDGNVVPTPTSTARPGSSPTSTSTATPTPTESPTPTASATPTETATETGDGLLP